MGKKAWIVGIILSCMFIAAGVTLIWIFQTPPPPQTPDPSGNYCLEIKIQGSGSTNFHEGEHYYENKTELTLWAFPENDSEFDRFVIDGAENTSNPLKIFLDREHVLVEVIFSAVSEEEIFYNVEIRVVGVGTTDPAPGNYTLKKGTKLDVSAIETDDKHAFDHWGGDVSGVLPLAYIEVNKDNMVVIANFAEKTVMYSLRIIIYYNPDTFANGFGETDPPEGEYYLEAGTIATLIAIPESGSAFAFWTPVLDSNYRIYQNPLDLTINSNMKMFAIFYLK